MHKCYNYTKIKKGEPNLEKLKNCLDKWGHYNVLSFYGSFLSFLGTVTLGAYALLMSKNANKISKKANDLSEKVIEMERKDRKTFISIDIEKKLNIYFINKDPLFINILNNKDINFSADFIENTLNTNDIILFEFYLKNISSNYATGIYLNKFEIHPEFDSVSAVALACDADNSNIIEPNQSKKVILLVSGLKLYLNKEPIDYIGNICDFKMEISVLNLVGEETIVSIELFAETYDFNEALGQKSFELCFNEFKVIS